MTDQQYIIQDITEALLDGDERTASLLLDEAPDLTRIDLIFKTFKDGRHGHDFACDVLDFVMDHTDHSEKENFGRVLFRYLYSIFKDTSQNSFTFYVAEQCLRKDFISKYNLGEFIGFSAEWDNRGLFDFFLDRAASNGPSIQAALEQVCRTHSRTYYMEYLFQEGAQVSAKCFDAVASSAQKNNTENLSALLNQSPSFLSRNPYCDGGLSEATKQGNVAYIERLISSQNYPVNHFPMHAKHLLLDYFIHKDKPNEAVSLVIKTAKDQGSLKQLAQSILGNSEKPGYEMRQKSAGRIFSLFFEDLQEFLPNTIPASWLDLPYIKEWNQKLLIKDSLSSIDAVTPLRKKM